MAHPNENVVVSQDELLAHLDSMEKSLKKGGDALQNAPHDGGFATQGTNIQEKAKKMYKALRKSGYKRSDAKALVAKAYGGDDDSSSDGSSVAKAYGGDDDSSSDGSSVAKALDADGDSDGDSDSDSDSDSASDESSPDESSDESSLAPMNKSLGAAQLANAAGNKREDSLRKSMLDQNPDLQGTFDAAPILGQLIDSIDRMLKSGGDRLSKKDLGQIRKALVEQESTQRQFNGKLAKALSMIAQRVIDTEAIVKRMASEPVNTSNRAPTLRKSDLSHPQFHNGDTTRIAGGTGNPNQDSPLREIEYLKIQEVLTDICMKGGADLMDITKFENSKGDLSLLPPNVVKQLEQRLCPAS